MDREERRARQADLALRQVHHQADLRHAHLQRKFLFALTLAAGLFLSVLRSEVPGWVGWLALAPLLWAAREAWSIQALVTATDKAGARVVEEAGQDAPKGSTGEEAKRT